MERLTEKQSSGFDLKSMNGEWCNKYCEQQRVQTCNECGIYQAIQKLAEYEDLEEIFRAKSTDTVCEFLKDKEEFSKWLDRIEWIAKKCDEYAIADEQGLLMRLPCKVGTKVYAINRIIDYGKVGDEAIYCYSIIERELQIYIMMDYGKLEFGRNVFLTKAEAEQKLK